MAMLVAGLLVGCGNAASQSSTDTTEETSASNTQEAGEGLDADSIKTMGDVYALTKDEYTEQKATYADKFIYAFSVDGVLYRATADLPADVSEALFALEFDEDYEQNEMDLVKDLEVTSFENLEDQKLSQEELDALVGKTGQELFDEGWRSGSFYNTDTLEVWLEYGPFAYAMHFDGEIAPEDAETFDPYEDLTDKKVLDATFADVGDATYME